MIWCSMTFRLWIASQPATLQMIPLGFKVPQALALYEVHLSEARRTVSRHYAPIWRRLPAQDSDMIRWLISWDFTAPVGHAPEYSPPAVISSITATLHDVTNDIYGMLHYTDEDTLHLRDLCHVQYQMTADYVFVALLGF